MSSIETTIAEELRKLRPGAPEAAPTARLSADLGLTSIKMVLLLTALCQRLEIPMTAITENDLAEMTTPAMIASRLTPHLPQKAA